MIVWVFKNEIVFILANSSWFLNPSSLFDKSASTASTSSIDLVGSIPTKDEGNTGKGRAKDLVLSFAFIIICNFWSMFLKALQILVLELFNI